MEITKRYTIENWRTGEIELHEIPDAVLSLTFEEVLEKTLGEMGSIGLNPIETLFACLFLHDDWQVKRTPLNRSRPVTRYIAAGIEDATDVRDALFGRGVPDFFLWDTAGQHRFVEIKASENQLNSNQQKWAESYDCHFSIAQLVQIAEGLSEKEIIEENRIVPSSAR